MLNVEWSQAAVKYVKVYCLLCRSHVSSVWNRWTTHAERTMTLSPVHAFRGLTGNRSHEASLPPILADDW